MNKVEIKLAEGTPKLEYACKGDSGFDVRAMNIKAIYHGLKNLEVIDENRFIKASNNFIERGYIKLRPNERVLFGTGIFCGLPEGKELQCRPKSGQSLKKGLNLVNAPGTIDTNYRDREICVIIKNGLDELVQIDYKEKIAQLVLADVVQAEFIYVDEIDTTNDRGGGFGSSGIK